MLQNIKMSSLRDKLADQAKEEITKKAKRKKAARPPKVETKKGKKKKLK